MVVEHALPWCACVRSFGGRKLQTCTAQVRSKVEVFKGWRASATRALEIIPDSIFWWMSLVKLKEARAQFLHENKSTPPRFFLRGAISLDAALQEVGTFDELAKPWGNFMAARKLMSQLQPELDGPKIKSKKKRHNPSTCVVQGSITPPSLGDWRNHFYSTDCLNNPGEHSG